MRPIKRRRCHGARSRAHTVDREAHQLTRDSRTCHAGAIFSRMVEGHAVVPGSRTRTCELGLTRLTWITNADVDDGGQPVVRPVARAAEILAAWRGTCKSTRPGMPSLRAATRDFMEYARIRRRITEVGEERRPGAAYGSARERSTRRSTGGRHHRRPEIGQVRVCAGPTWCGWPRAATPGDHHVASGGGSPHDPTGRLAAHDAGAAQRPQRPAAPRPRLARLEQRAATLEHTRGRKGARRSRRRGGGRRLKAEDEAPPARAFGSRGASPGGPSGGSG